jgi:hypothetical protein
LRPLTATRLTIGASNNTLTFTRKKGKEMLYTSESKDSIYFVKVDSAVINEQLLIEYAGEYYSPEAQTTVFLKIKNGGLFWFRHPKTELPLTPTYKDAFETFFGSMYFERGRNNKISGLKVTVSRARNISFVKVDKRLK